MLSPEIAPVKRPEALVSPTTERARPSRQDEIVDAAVRVLARDGLSGSSLRAIAREMGYTTGVVAHYFRDKEELLVAAAAAVFGPFDDLLAEVLPMDDAFEGLRRLCLIPLPTTRAKQVMPRIYLQVLANAESEPAFAAAFAQRYAAIRDGIAALLSNGQRNGTLRTDFDPATQCDLLCALVDGLAIHAVAEPRRFPARRLTALVEQELERLRV
ncbi:MAG: TetR/AcrR family transcriptional regulator [Sporichthyaceae bacterium]